MGVTKQILQEGNKQDYPQKGDMISMHYTGCLYNESAPNKMGDKYVYSFSSTRRLCCG